MELNGLAAVVTGGASGLGEATAVALAEAGARVAIFDIQEERGREVASRIGGCFHKVDVTDDAAVDAGFAAARGAHGQERILIACAGTGVSVKTASRAKEDGAIRHFPTDLFERIVRINLVGTFRCVAKSAAGMLGLDALESGERGAMVLTASVAAEEGQIGQAAYSASKGGIVSMTLPIARDLSGERIRVNTILPGLFDTPLLRGLPPAVQESLGESVPFPRRLGAPREYAELALSMCRNSYLNGEDVRLDGALRMAPR